jgi:RNA polymerase sigma factor (sigma-70 family)
VDDQELLNLIRAAQAGDQLAFGELVRRFQDMAYGYAYAILKDFQQAEDAAQEAFIEAYRCLPKLEIPQAFPVWLKRIIFKHCDRLTRGKRPILAPLDCTSESDVAAIVIESGAGTQTDSLAEVYAEHAEMRHRVMEALDALTDDQRTVTTLYYIPQHSAS